MESVKTHSLKWISDIIAGSETWYDLEADPGEQAPLESPGEEGLALATHGRRISARGSSGLHILITSPGDERRLIEGTVTGKGCTEAYLRYPRSLGNAYIEGGQVRFRINMPEFDAKNGIPGRLKDMGEDPLLPLLFLQEGQRRDHALMVVELDEATDVALSLTCNGAPVGPRAVHAGDDGHHRELAGESVPLMELLADPGTYDALQLPNGFRVYVWYVPRVERIHADEMDGDMRDALEATGYL